MQDVSDKFYSPIVQSWTPDGVWDGHISHKNLNKYKMSTVHANLVKLRYKSILWCAKVNFIYDIELISVSYVMSPHSRVAILIKIWNRFVSF